jgi:isocitrate/isopropylmalate dehydrogenase
MNTCEIAVIPRESIGKERVPEGLKVLEAAGARFEATRRSHQSACSSPCVTVSPSTRRGSKVEALAKPRGKPRNLKNLT